MPDITIGWKFWIVNWKLPAPQWSGHNFHQCYTNFTLFQHISDCAPYTTVTRSLNCYNLVSRTTHKCSYNIIVKFEQFVAWKRVVCDTFFRCMYVTMSNPWILNIVRNQANQESYVHMQSEAFLQTWESARHKTLYVLNWFTAAYLSKHSFWYFCRIFIIPTSHHCFHD